MLQGVTKIKFVTDGLLLREMMDDPLLTRYRYVAATAAWAGSSVLHSNGEGGAREEAAAWAGLSCVVFNHFVESPAA